MRSPAVVIGLTRKEFSKVGVTCTEGEEPVPPTQTELVTRSLEAMFMFCTKPLITENVDTCAIIILL